MSNFYFFENSGICNNMKKAINENLFTRFLNDPIDYKGKKVKFYFILNWIHRNNHGANIAFLDQFNINYVPALKDLPEGAGAFSFGYDVNLEDLKIIEEQNIPFIEHSCPQIKKLREQLLAANPETHQIIFMILEYHIVHDCFKSAFPDDIIVIQPENYEERIRSLRNNKPIHFLAYGVFRPKEVKAVLDFINSNYNNHENILDSYDTTRCCWTKQGLIEEIQNAVKNNNLNEVWIICSNEKDTSTIGIIKEVMDNKAEPVIIKKIEDIPKKIKSNINVGVLIAPIPLPDAVNNYVNLIKKRFCSCTIS